MTNIHIFIFIKMIIMSNCFEYKCLNSTSCARKGVCLNETHCLCNKGYITTEESDYQCDYKQLSKRNAFLISFFIGPTGIDQLYYGHIIYGVLKLLINMILLIFGVFLIGKGKKINNDIVIVIGKLFETGSTVIITIWWLVDWILILCNYYKDSNGKELYSDL